MTEIIAVRSQAEIAAIVTLARRIWTEHYVPIIGRAQVDYMLARFQSEQAITAQIADGQEYFLLRDGDEEAAYLALVPDAAGHSLMISKIYVASTCRGRGLGRRLLAFTEDLARQRGIPRLWLTVNKHNRASIRWYEGMGFRKTGALVQDIGGGFVMDDYRFEKVLPDGPPSRRGGAAAADLTGC